MSAEVAGRGGIIVTVRWKMAHWYTMALGDPDADGGGTG